MNQKFKKYKKIIIFFKYLRHFVGNSMTAQEVKEQVIPLITC